MATLISMNDPLSADALLALSDAELHSVHAFYLGLTEDLTRWRTQARVSPHRWLRRSVSGRTNAPGKTGDQTALEAPPS